MRRFFRNPTGLLGLGIVAFFIVTSLLAPVLSPYDSSTDRNLRLRLTPPSWSLSAAERQELDLNAWSLPFGTDQQGRDLFVRVWHGGRISLRVGLFAVAIASSVGILLGLLAGYAGGWLDTVVVWLVDILLAFPGILLAIAIVAILGPSLTNALIAIGITQIPIYTRVTRSVVLGLRESEYVQAARALGSGGSRVVFFAHPAQLAFAHHRAAHLVHRRGDFGRGGVGLPGLGRAAARARVGGDDQGRVRQVFASALHVDLSGSGNFFIRRGV